MKAVVKEASLRNLVAEEVAGGLSTLRVLNQKLSLGRSHIYRLWKLSVLRTLFAALKHGQGLRVLVFPQATLAVKGRLEVGKGAVFLFNEPWPFSGAEPGSLVIMRNATVRLTGGNFAIKSGAFVEVKDGALLELHGGGYASRNLQIECRSRITIGAGAAIGPDVIIRDNDGHQLTNANHDTVSHVRIGENVWLGARSTILKGVTIGSGSIIAAGALVVDDVPENSLVGGVPAKVIRNNVSWK
ncbi:acyltransferase [Bradyrhizobium sp. RT5a]|uniref:acyltransferase n=1 Tax=Bradyrhizobium sp. RT5a TaxID=3156380 RepID=UPI0033944B8E